MSSPMHIYELELNWTNADLWIMNPNKFIGKKYVEMNFETDTRTSWAQICQITIEICVD